MTSAEEPVEFSRPLAVARIPEEGCVEDIVANVAECAAIAGQLKVPAVSSLEARLSIEPWRRGSFRVRGDVRADVQLICVVSLDEFQSSVDGPVDRIYLSETAPGHTASVVSVEDPESDEPETISSGIIDLAGLVTETLALALDPYPRKPGVDFSGYQAPAGGQTESAEKQSPFAALKKLRET